jgi:hypothetical protein
LAAPAARLEEVRAQPAGKTFSFRYVRGPWSALVSCLVCGCAPELDVGTWDCGDPDWVAPFVEPISSPWQTGFELGFCDYVRAQGFCYADRDASFEIVDSQSFTGKQAAAFSVTTEDGTVGRQTRCVREGQLPADAIYGAWFLIPSPVETTGVWNLMHFTGGEPGSRLPPLWDVSLDSDDNGRLSAYVLNYLGDSFEVADAPPEVPIGSWFHLEFRLRRSATADGEVALYQDGELVLERRGIQTDDTNWGQWYVGNWASDITPPDSTLYVDDVSIRNVP